MPSNNIPQNEESLKEVKPELKGIEYVYFWGRDAEKVAALYEQGKLRWRELTDKELGELLQQRIELAKLIKKPLEELLKTTGLSREEAKTVIYWATATYGLDDLDSFPILVLQGKPETGKSTIMKVIAKLVGLTEKGFISITTPSEFRELLMKNRIALIEEGDKVNEDLLLRRYSKQSGAVDIKQQVGVTGGIAYIATTGNIYGATVLHKRYPFEELALETRAITIKTEKQYKIFSDPQLDFEVNLKELWEYAWERFSHYQASGGRVATNWRPLIIVALAVGDLDWIRYANEQQKLTQKDLAVNGEFEPEQVLAYVIDYFVNEKQPFVYLSAVISHLKQHYNWTPTAKRIAKLLRGMGYEVKHHKLGFALELQKGSI